MYISINKLSIGPIKQIFLIKESEHFYAKSKKSTKFHLIDKTGQISANLWEVESNLTGFVDIVGNVITYKNKPEIIIQSIGQVPDPSNLEDYLRILDKVTQDRLHKELLDKVGAIQDQFIRRMIQEILPEKSEQNSLQEFKFETAPLSDRRPFNYCGALLEQTVYNLRILDSVYLNFLDRAIDYNLDICKAILIFTHSGAMYGLTDKFSPKLTEGGKLVGLDFMSQNIAYQCAMFSGITSQHCLIRDKIIHGIQACWGAEYKSIEAKICSGILSFSDIERLKYV